MLKRETLLSAFQGAIRPVPVSLFYRLGLLLVALTMILMPLVYVALIVLVARFTFWHATHNTTILTGGRPGIGTLMVYVTPILAGGVLVLFMIKPLFAGRGVKPTEVEVDFGREPRLVEFIRKICAIVGAPEPRRIVVDCDVNASAGFRRGVWSFFGNDLQLTIGLPLVGGFTLRQFAGVLAHELGHFSQGTGMRLSYVIRSINHWFARVVYERDSWDDALVEWGRDTDGRIAIILLFIRFCVWLTRRVLWVFMALGVAISTFMMRQMEYDADRYAAQLAGSEVFGEIARGLARLSLGNQLALRSLRTAWAEKRLGDDFTALMIAELDRLPAAAVAEFTTAFLTRKASLFDSHPPDQARIDNSLRENSPGIFKLEGPAADLFRDFPALCREATFDFLQENLGVKIKKQNLISTEAMLGRKEEERADHEALDRYCGESVTVHSPIFLPDLAPTAPGQDAVERLKVLRARIGELTPQVAPEVKRLGESAEMLAAADQVASLLVVGLNPAKFGFKLTTSDEVRVARELGRKMGETAEATLEPLREAIRERLSLAVRLVRDPSRPPEPELDRLLAALDAFQIGYQDLSRLAKGFAVMTSLLQSIKGGQPDEKLANAIMGESRRLATALRALAKSVGTTPYPFDHAQGQIALKAYARLSAPNAEDLPAVLEHSERAIELLTATYLRTLGRLCRIAERLETSLGL